jgi:NAD(P)-dependent dehydrogenase (short-subunit alcohol dehydrogenase family)
MPYRDRVVIVTGGSRGIGEGIVRAFVAAGATVSFCDLRAPEGEALADELGRAVPGRVTFSPCDVTDPRALERWIDATAGAAGRLDCLVNNAGWHPPHQPIDAFSVADFRALLELNLIGTFTACRAALPHLRKSKGNVINIGSLVGTIGQRHAVTYAATKGAVIAFTKALAIDEAPHGVRVNSISPGNIATPLWTEGAAATPDPARAEADGAAAQGLGRMGTVAEVADLAVFLAARATFTTGVDHLLSGGAELGYGRKA